MKFSPNAKAALQQPDTKAKMIPFTPELREKLATVCNEVVELLIARTESPFEAYMILQFATQALEEMTGIRGGIVMEKGDEAH